MFSGTLPTSPSAEPSADDGPEALFARVFAQQLRSAMPEEALGGEWGDAFGPLLDELLAAEIQAKLEGKGGPVSRPLAHHLHPRGRSGRGHGHDHSHDVGAVTSRFGQRIHPVTGERRHHAGVDLAAPRGTPIQLGRGGTVVRAEKAGTYGNLVVVDHGDGVTTRYAHLHGIDVKVGEAVSAGATIGSVGSTGRSTGPHLHFEVRIGERAVDPQDRPYNDLFPQLAADSGR
jgi:murein DD-endopeptidase MepM/ murein hydrolase activator NlpD